MKLIPTKLFTPLQSPVSKAAAVLAITALAFSQSAQGAARTWSGAADNSMSNGSNWSTLPVTGDSFTFTSATGLGGLNLNNNLTSGAFTVAGITFNAGAAAFVIGDGTTTPNVGNTFVLGGNITNSGTNLETINNPFSSTVIRTVTTTTGGGNLTFGGDISGSGGEFTTAGSGTLTLSGNNSFTGNSTTVNADTAVVGVVGTANNIVSIGSNTALGASTALYEGLAGTIQAVGGARVVSNGYWTANANSTIAGSNALTFNGLLQFAGSNTITSTNSALTTFGGGVHIRDNGTAARSATFNGNGNILINSVISNGLTGTAGSVIYAGTGTLTLSAANTYSAGTTVSSGTIALDFSQAGAPTTNILSGAATLSGGTLSIIGNSGTNSQALTGLTFTANTSSFLSFTQGGATNLNATLGGLTRNAQSTVDVTLPTTGTVSSTTTTSNGTNKLNGATVAYATANGGRTWLVNTAGTLTALGAGSYNTDGFTVLGDTDITLNDTPTAFTVNTLRFNTANTSANTSLTLNSSGVSTISAGGILVTPNGTNSSIVSGGGSAGLTASTAAEIVIHDYADLNIGAPITGSAVKLTNAGTGTTTLSGTNSYTGATSANSGTLSLTGSIGVGGGTAITVGPLATFTESAGGVIGGTSAVTSSGTTTLNGANTYTGATTITTGTTTLAGSTTTSGVTLNGGTLNVNSAGALGTGTFNIANAGVIINNTSAGLVSVSTSPPITFGNSFTFTGSNSLNLGAGAVSDNGDRTVTLNGNNSNTLTFGGTVTNTATTAKTLTVNNGTGVSGETLIFNNGLNLATGGASVVYVLTGTGNLTINGAVADGAGSATSGFTKNGTGTLTLTGANTYSGTAALTAGTLNLNNNGALSGSTFTISGGTIDAAAAPITAPTNNPAIALTGSFGFGGTNSLNFGTGTATINNDVTVTLNGNNSNTLTVGGTLSNNRLNTGVNIGANNAAGVSGETLILNNGFNLATNSVAAVTDLFSGSGNITVNGVVANGNANANPVTYQGTGTLTLNGVSTYTGATLVTSGKVIVGDATHASASLASSVTVNAGTIGGAGTVNAPVTVGNSAGVQDSFISPGNSPGTFTTTGALAINSDGVYKFELNSTTGLVAADQIIANGVTLSSSATFSFTDLGDGSGAAGNTFTIISNTAGTAISGTFSNLAEGGTIVSNGVTYTASYLGGDGNDLVLVATAAVPEPSTWAMIFSGAAMLIGVQRFKRRS